MKRLAAVFCVALALSSCSAPKPDMARITKAIDEFNAKSAKDMIAGVWDSTMATYTDDAYSLPNSMPMAKGKTAIKESYRKMMASGMKITRADFKTLDVRVGGDQVVEVGTYAMSMDMPPIGAIHDTGKYVTVYTYSADGALKVRVETWNSDSPPAAQTPPNQ